jgi:hypothetical protein
MFTIDELATIPLFSALEEKALEYLAALLPIRPGLHRPSSRVPRPSAGGATPQIRAGRRLHLAARAERRCGAELLDPLQRPGDGIGRIC